MNRVGDEVAGLRPDPAEEKPQGAAVSAAARAVYEAERGADPKQMATALAALGRAQIGAGAADFAIATLERAAGLYASLPPSLEQAENLLTLSEAYEACGRHREALVVHRRFHAVQLNLSQRYADEHRRAEELAAQLQRTRDELVQALKRQGELSELNTHLKRIDRQKTELLQQAERFSLEDSVTRVHNRRCLDVRLAADVQRSRRYASPLTVAMVDIDNFKAINDHHSHSQGDAVLRAVARIMKEAVRGTDYVARYGGDEFVLVFPETPLARALPVCGMIRQLIDATDWSSVADRLKVTVTIGVAERPPSATNHDALLNAADRMLHHAKMAGKNRVFPEGAAEAAERL